MIWPLRSDLLAEIHLQCAGGGRIECDADVTMGAMNPDHVFLIAWEVNVCDWRQRNMTATLNADLARGL